MNFLENQEFYANADLSSYAGEWVAIVDRKSRFLLAKKVSRLRNSMEDGFKKIIEGINIHSLTLDNGVENVRYKSLNEPPAKPPQKVLLRFFEVFFVYFCDFKRFLASFFGLKNGLDGLECGRFLNQNEDLGDSRLSKIILCYVDLHTAIYSREHSAVLPWTGHRAPSGLTVFHV